MVTDRAIDDVLKILGAQWPNVMAAINNPIWKASLQKLCRRHDMDDEVLRLAAVWILENRASLNASTNMLVLLKEAAFEVRKAGPVQAFGPPCTDCDEGWLALPLGPRLVCIPCPYCQNGSRNSRANARYRKAQFELYGAEAAEASAAQIAQALQAYDKKRGKHDV